MQSPHTQDPVLREYLSWWVDVHESADAAVDKLLGDLLAMGAPLEEEPGESREVPHCSRRLCLTLVRGFRDVALAAKMEWQESAACPTAGQIFGVEARVNSLAEICCFLEGVADLRDGKIPLAHSCEDCCLVLTSFELATVRWTDLIDRAEVFQEMRRVDASVPLIPRTMTLQ